MFIFGGDVKARGCYRQMMERGVLGTGCYLTLPKAGDYPSDFKGTSATPEPLFVTGVEFAQKERYHIVQCFGDRNYTYAFGHDPVSSLLSVSFVAFLTYVDGKPNASSLYHLTEGYSKGRLTKSLDFATLTLGWVTLTGFVVGMRTATLDPHFNLQSFQIDLLLVNAQTGSK